MLSIGRALAAVSVLLIVPGAAFAQIALAGTVKDPTGAVLPGVTIEASSPVLIERVRTATSDTAFPPAPGRYVRISFQDRGVGFTADVSSRELAELGRLKNVPVMEDLGSGCFVDLSRHGFPHEPTVPDVVASGVDLVSFSGDKLLGGPQAGIVVGRADLVERLTKNPLNRALRIDKFTVAALEGTLYAYEAGTALETIPTLRMLTEPLSSVRRRAQALLRRLPVATRTSLGAQVTETRSQVGGGALPTVELPTAALALGTPTRAAHELDETLRSGRPSILGRLVDDRLLLDCRTILAVDMSPLAERLIAIA